ncbi:TIGR01440 family protein [Polycladomyces subterraneus]|uniref:UPF0340 protein NWF35_02445 n=1 Tax=Polycladomyces subterraneus TaxID=1016997 RepID=A0ABT8IK71_9BACL|nr:TIGR01440 family protein [Polycladomyces subterraneus]MDN4592787.1 TIGR01440 family protein [Polycladomyces subterraneus]
MSEAKPDLFTPGQVVRLVDELVDEKPLDERHLLVVGVSTSEVIGKRIGTAGNDEVAQAIFQELMEAQQKYGFHLAFQCCEHLNRALVVRRETMERFQLEEVTVVPVPKAGGAMAAYAYRHLDEAVIVESVRADAGIDIGDTLIGMHLKPVAVPVRPSCRQIGEAHVTMAKTRPKLIGGARAVYTL